MKQTFPPLIFTALIVGTLLFLGSCGKQHVSVVSNAFADKSVIPRGFTPGDSFSIKPANENDELFSKEVGQKIKILLNDRGYRVKTAGADYDLVFAFDMKKSKHTRLTPIYTPGYVPYYDPYYYHRYSYHHTYTTTYVPEQYTRFDKKLVVAVHDNTGIEKKTIWSSAAVTSELDSDLRRTIDYLLITIFQNFGQDTAQAIETNINYGNAVVTDLRNRYLQPLGLNIGLERTQ